MMGRFKGEDGERNDIVLFANESKSGLKIRRALERLIVVLMNEGRENVCGPAICDADGWAIEGWKMNKVLHEILNRVKEKHPDYFDERQIIEDKYSVFRSFKRGAHTRATEAEVPQSVIDMNNRWKKVQQNKGGTPHFKMSKLYLQKCQTLSTQTKFSASL